MKICVTAQGPSLNGEFERHFAKAPYFIFYDSTTKKSESIRNGFVASDSGLGRNTVRLLEMHGITDVITGETGDAARALLAAAGISLHLFDGSGRVRDALKIL